jgi:hypothetical protein
VAIDSIDDMRVLFNEIPLDKVSTSMTINAPASLLLLLYQLVAEESGVAGAALNGTVQNDILKEYIARGTYIFPPKPSLRLVADTSHLPHGRGRVSVVAHLGRQVERYRQTGLALLQQILEAPIRVRRAGKTGVLAHCPQAAAIHRWLDAAREWIPARFTELCFGVPADEFIRSIERLDLDVAGRREAALVVSHRRGRV